MRIDFVTTVQLLLAGLWLATRSTLGQGDVDDLDQYGLLGAQHEFKFDVGPGDAECFYQKAKQGAHFQVTFEVLRGADRNVDVYIRQPGGRILDQHLWTSSGVTDKIVQLEGDYAICIDNGNSRFSSKLVYLFISTYKEEEWNTFIGEMEAADASLQDTQKAVDGVRSKVAKMAHLIGLGRVRSGKDYYVALTNNQTVQNMSILTICVFVITSAVQVFFVKNMFKSAKVTPSQKPRA